MPVPHHVSAREETEALLTKEAHCAPHNMCLACWSETPGKVRNFSLTDSRERDTSEFLEQGFVQGKGNKFTLRSMCNDVKEESDWLLTVVEGWTKHPRILRYDIKALIQGGGWNSLFHWGTVASNGNGFFRYLLVMFLFSATIFGLMVWGYRRDMSHLEAIDVAPFNKLLGHVNKVVTFITAQFIVICLGRWWSIRTMALQRVLESFSDLCMILCSELRGKRWDQVKVQVLKYGFATLELVLMALKDETPDLGSLVTRGLLTGSEASFLEKQRGGLWQRPYTVWTWTSRICFQALDVQKSAQCFRGAVTGKCIAALNGIMTISKFMDTQLPFAYVHVIVLMVNVQNLVHGAETGIAAAKAFAKEDWQTLCFEVAGLMTQVFVYSSLMQIACFILDPFGDNTLAFPLESYEKFMAANLDAALEAQHTCLLVAEDGSLYSPEVAREKPTFESERASSDSGSWYVESVSSSSSDGGVFSVSMSSFRQT